MSGLTLTRKEFLKINCKWKDLFSERPPQKKGPMRLLVTNGKTIAVADYIFTGVKNSKTSEIEKFKGVFHVYKEINDKIACLTCLFKESYYKITHWQYLSSQMRNSFTPLPISLILKSPPPPSFSSIEDEIKEEFMLE